MTGLTPRQRVQINAALALIHTHGHDPRAVQQTFSQHLGRRLGAKSAYERALKDFIKDKPELAGQMRHTLQLIDASDDQTVARYGAAVDQYNETGSAASLDVIAQTFQQDSAVLAARMEAPTARMSFSGKDAAYYQPSATTHRASYQEDKRVAAGLAQASQRTSAEPGQAAVIEKSGWSPSNTYG